MALVIHLNLYQKSWDIQKAYVWSELKEEERLIIKYPKGLERYHPESGEELFMVLQRSLYGLPNAGRQFTQKRDNFLLTEFNKKGWRCRRCTMDPCMFIMTKQGKRTWILCYVDDLDGASECKEHLDEIYETMDKAWKCKEVPSSFMLGIKRTRTEDDGICMMHMSMEAYVEGMHNAFLDYVPKRILHIPCEYNLMLNLDKGELNEENRRVLKRGYQSAVGMVLWAARGVYPQSLYAVQQLCKVMSKPTEQAWDAAMHLIAWMYQKRKVGITFRSDSNSIPVFMSDASNKGDSNDSKRAYGFCGIWMGGPILMVSKKMDHSSSATAANEYMALSHATKAVIWLRQFMKEMELGNLVSKPTEIYGDNKSANQWANEERITQGNMWILQCYHYVKEMVQEDQVTIKRIGTKYNISDLATKGVSKETMEFLAPYVTGKETIENLLDLNRREEDEKRTKATDAKDQGSKT